METATNVKSATSEESSSEETAIIHALLEPIESDKNAYLALKDARVAKTLSLAKFVFPPTSTSTELACLNVLLAMS
jgi:hypothetical protein